MATSNVSSTIASAAEQAANRVGEAKAAAEEGLAGAVNRGAGMAREARDAWGEVDTAVREAVRERPYTALAIAAAAGFLYALARGR